ncbi:TPA: LD-carboxypeptidase [Serratia marcescens]
MLIHLIASSTAFNERLIPEIVRMFTDKGYLVETCYLNQLKSELGYVDSDNARALNLIEALSDSRVEMLWFVNGGGGAFNLLPYLIRALPVLMKAKPKIITGLSDVTALHYFVNKYLGWKSVHGVLATFNKEMHAVTTYEPNRESSIDDVFNIMREGNFYRGLLLLNNVPSHDIKGTLTGGNLTLFQSLFSTHFEKNYLSDIPILEDVNLTHRQFDRMLNQLANKKDFEPNAMIFGQFHKIDADDPERLIFRRVIDFFAEKVSYPVFYYPYFGHGEKNQPMILNHEVTIKKEISKNTYSLHQCPL